MKRASGILLPVSSLPSRFGIGCFSREAYAFIDCLAAAGQRYWQVLPLSPTGFGDSPYQSFSAFAGNPYFIDLEDLIAKGLLTEAECAARDFGSDPARVDYGKLYENRLPLLRLAYARSTPGAELEAFCRGNEDWLDDYALFMALKAAFGGSPWHTWPAEIRTRDPKALDRCRQQHREEIRFQKYLQFLFHSQWQALKAYAGEKGVQIIGDIPIYAAFDSADAWASPELFQFDDSLLPTAVAGCPPDGFSPDGQLWGNPLYRWEYHRETGFSWWCQRMDQAFRLYDVVRIDHFRGFDAYYAIPYGEPTARGGRWEKGPGMALFRVLNARLGEKPIIAEDLGFLTDSVRQLLKDSGYPGMKVLEFAFDPREESDYLPHTYDKNCVVYTGTHDNEPLVQWYAGLDKASRDFALDYMADAATAPGKRYFDFIRLAMMSVADTCIIPVQDYLGLGPESRINHPATLGGNWTWRMTRGQLTHSHIRQIRRLTALSGRLP